MKNVKRLRRNIRFILNSHNIFDAVIHHDGKGRQVIVSMPPTPEANQLVREISASKTHAIKCSNGNNLEVKAPNLNYLRNFFRRKLNLGMAEVVLD